jgi:hypothetical protein
LTGQPFSAKALAIRVRLRWLLAAIKIVGSSMVAPFFLEEVNVPGIFMATSAFLLFLIAEKYGFDQIAQQYDGR